MKARRVTGLEPQATLAANAQRIVLVRLDELCGFVPRALDPAEVATLHDMRIAAKRLRYVLELTAPVCFAPYAAKAARRAKELQDLLGEIHDCDVALPRVLALLEELRGGAALELRARAGDAEDLDPALVGDLPHGDAWRGLETLAVYLQARRALLFERFLTTWAELERKRFRERLETALSQPDDEGDPATGVSSEPTT